jgi:hypothetical protein
VFSLSGLTGLAQPNNTPIAKLVVKLTGDCLTTCTLGVAFQQIIAASNPALNVPEQSPNSMSFLRGDASGDGHVNIADAMFIAQYTVSLRTLGDLNGINAAGVNAANPDIINIVDAMFIAQYTVKLRGSSFN